MKALVTGSAGHLGEALVRSLQQQGAEVLGLDIKPTPFTHLPGSITDGEWVAKCLSGVDVVYHTATLHKPHVGTHSKQEFIDTNISGTLNLLQASVAAGVKVFVFTSTTSVFGDALRPAAGEPAVWVTEDLQPVPRNIYGVTKLAAENMCQLFHRNHGLNCIALRTSRFFPEEDDDRRQRSSYSSDNLKANEFLFRRVDIEDVVSAHFAAARQAPAIGFGCYIISATTPFLEADLDALRGDAAAVVARYQPEFAGTYSELNWAMFQDISRVYVNQAARSVLGWEPRYDFSHVIHSLRRGKDFKSPLAAAIGLKGYHDQEFEDGPYPLSN